MRWRVHLARTATAATTVMLIATLVLITWQNVDARTSASATPSAQKADADVGKLSAPPGEDSSSGNVQVDTPDAQSIHEAHLAADVGATEWPELQIGPNWDDWSVNVNSGDCATVFS